MTRPRIGFAGLGLMGSAMVQRLLDRGYALTVLGRRSRAGIDAATARGASEVTTGKALAEASDIVMLCLDTSANVEARMRGDDGILAGLAEGATVIDFGTSLPASTQALGAEAAARGAGYLDAPLGRTPAHAKDGLLNIMVGGDAATYDRVKPVLDDLGENVFHLGALGAGHTVKLINNFYGMTMACAMSEAFALADTAGIPRDAVYGAMSAGPLRSGMMDFINAYSTEGRIDLAFSIRNGAKDLGYYWQMAQDLGANSRMSGCAAATLNEAVDAGRGDDMVPQLVDLLAERLTK